MRYFIAYVVATHPAMRSSNYHHKNEVVEFDTEPTYNDIQKFEEETKKNFIREMGHQHVRVTVTCWPHPIP